MSRSGDSAVPQFGTRLPGQEYIYRPSAYVILPNDLDQVAIVRTPVGVFLPGGGQDPGESPEAAAVREVAEECGFAVELLGSVGVADQFAWSIEASVYYLKHSTFFRARIVGPARMTETDHELCWVSREEAGEAVSHESHRWAVSQACGSTTL